MNLLESDRFALELLPQRCPVISRTHRGKKRLNISSEIAVRAIENPLIGVCGMSTLKDTVTRKLLPAKFIRLLSNASVNTGIAVSFEHQRLKRINLTIVKTPKPVPTIRYINERPKKEMTAPKAGPVVPNPSPDPNSRCVIHP